MASDAVAHPPRLPGRHPMSSRPSEPRRSDRLNIIRARRIPADALHDYVTRLREGASGYDAVYGAP